MKIFTIGQTFKVKNLGLRGHLEIVGMSDQDYIVDVYSHGFKQQVIWSHKELMAHLGKEIFE